MKKLSISRSTLNKRVDINFRSIKLLIALLLIAGLAGFAASGYVWYTKIFTDNDRIFYGMLDKSLTTDSVTRTITQSEASRNEKQTYYISYSPNSALESVSTVEQIGKDRQKSLVATQTIGTRTADFVKYTAIQIPKTDATQPDYSKVLNDWAKRDGSGDKTGQTQFLNEAIFTFVPFGNFSQENRDTLIKLIQDKKVYVLNGGQISYEGGRPVYNVNASIKPQGLVEVLKEYAKLTGLGNESLLDPTQYDTNNSFSVGLKIDMLSRHLNQITYQDNTRQEVYESYGLKRPIVLPKQTITVEELQSRLQ